MLRINTKHRDIPTRFSGERAVDQTGTRFPFLSLGFFVCQKNALRRLSQRSYHGGESSACSKTVHTNRARSSGAKSLEGGEKGERRAGGGEKGGRENALNASWSVATATGL